MILIKKRKGRDNLIVRIVFNGAPLEIILIHHYHGAVVVPIGHHGLAPTQSVSGDRMKVAATTVRQYKVADAVFFFQMSTSENCYAILQATLGVLQTL